MTNAHVRGIVRGHSEQAGGVRPACVPRGTAKIAFLILLYFLFENVFIWSTIVQMYTAVIVASNPKLSTTEYRTNL